MSDFVLDPRLAADTVMVADWPLCRLLLMNDARFPWLVLVPRREGATELFHLAAGDRALLMEELALAGRLVAALPEVEKVNIGVLGNLVPQLHLHVVGRKPGDAAWPGPVWGSGPRVAYPPEGLARMVALVSDS